MIKYSLGIYLMILAYQDLKEQKILLSFTIIPILLGIINLGLQLDSGMEIFISCLPGVFFILLSLIWPNTIGIGDGIVLVALGFWITWTQVLMILFGALVVHSFWGIIVLIFKKGHFQKEICFIPFVCMSYWSCLIGGI